MLRNLNNSGARAVESDALQFNKNAYGIRLFLTREVVDAVVARSKTRNSIFIQSAYATSIECPPRFIYNPNDTIVSIRIFTMNDFDNQHSENSDITAYFRIAHSFSTVENFVANMRYTYEVNFENWWREVTIDLLLMTAPTTNGFHQFKVQIELSDGRILEQKTTEIELL